MKYLAAYALAWLSGKASPTAKDLEPIVKSAGGDFDSKQAELLVEALKDKSLHELIASGKGKLSGISLSGGSAAGASADTKGATETKEEKKEEKKDEDEDAALGGGMGLFGDDEW
jgi:large subunit ribosomal protein LP2